MILGGSIWRQAIKEFAKQNGIVLISAGLYPAGTDEIADEVYRIDTTDVELMKPFIKEQLCNYIYKQYMTEKQALANLNGGYWLTINNLRVAA